MKYSADYLVFVVSKEIEAVCCGRDGAPLELPDAVARKISKLGGISSLMRQLPKESKVKNAARSHQALSDPIRLRIMWALAMSDLCPCVLKQITGLTDSKLSYHLGVLESAGLVRSKRAKNWMIYSITALGSKKLDME